MRRVKDHNTPYLIDPFHYLGPKRRRLLDSSWAGVFRRYVRPILPVHLLARHFSPDTGRPTNELVAMMGAMILQQMHDLTDAETQEQVGRSSMTVRGLLSKNKNTVPEHTLGRHKHPWFAPGVGGSRRF